MCLIFSRAPIHREPITTKRPYNPRTTTRPWSIVVTTPGPIIDWNDPPTARPPYISRPEGSGGNGFGFDDNDDDFGGMGEDDEDDFWG